MAKIKNRKLSNLDKLYMCATAMLHSGFAHAQCTDEKNHVSYDLMKQMIAEDDGNELVKEFWTLNYKLYRQGIFMLQQRNYKQQKQLTSYSDDILGRLTKDESEYQYYPGIVALYIWRDYLANTTISISLGLTSSYMDKMIQAFEDYKAQAASENVVKHNGRDVAVLGSSLLATAIQECVVDGKCIPLAVKEQLLKARFAKVRKETGKKLISEV